MEKDWKFLIENRFWNFDQKFWKLKNFDFRIFRFSKIFNENLDFSILKNFHWNSNENFDFRKFSIEISKSIFDQKFSIFFHELFFKPLLFFPLVHNIEVRNRETVGGMRQIDSSETKKRILFCTILTFLEVIRSEIRESALY